MKPSEFFEIFVMENYNNFRNDSDNLILAFNAVVAVFHMADHYYYYNKKHAPRKVEGFDRDGFVKHLSATNEYFRDIQSIANVYKHLYDYPSKKPWVTVESAGAITVREGDLEIESISAEVIYRNIKKNKDIELSYTLENVIKMWETLLQRGD